MRIRRTIVTAGLESGDSAGDERGVTRADECCVQLSFTEPALGGPGRDPFSEPAKFPSGGRGSRRAELRCVPIPQTTVPSPHGEPLA